MSNPAGNYSIIKVWGTSDTILASDLNAEFNNVLANFNPEMLAGYSQNQAQMQIQTYPGGVGSESLATSISGELERLRYMLNAIMGTTYWYQQPASTIAQLNSALGAASQANKINSGITTGTTGSAQPCFLVPSNTTQTVNMAGATTPLSYTIAGVNYVISSNVSVTGLTLGGGTVSTNTCTVNDLTLAQAGTQSTPLLGENGSVITIGNVGTSISNQVGNICAFEVSATAELFLAKVESATQLSNCFRGYFFNSSSALVSRGTLASAGTISMLNIAWIYATTSGSLVAGYNNPAAGGIAPTSPASGNYWFDTATNAWMIYQTGNWVVANATLVGMVVQNGTACIGARSFDFYAAYSDLNTMELFADQTNDATVVRSRFQGAQVNLYGNTTQFPQSDITWNFGSNMDTGAQAASTMYYFYLDTNGRSWISLVAPFDRRADLRGYYHPGQPWRCLGYGWSNSNTQLENVESFFVTDTTTPVSNITTAANVVLPYNIVQREQLITLTGAGGPFTQVLPPPAQLKGKSLTFVRTDNNIGTAVTIQGWGTAAANPTGTISAITNPTIMTGLSAATGLAAGQLITGPGIAPNTTLLSLAGATAATMSTSALLSVTNGTFTYANSAGYSGTVGQQTAYAQYGIGGLFTIKLISQYETVTISSDGYAYYVVNRNIPRVATNYGTLAITGSTTNPSLGSTSFNQFVGWREGNMLAFQLLLNQTSGGTSGSGDYSIALPANMTVDTNIITTLATVESGSFPHPADVLGSGMFLASTTQQVAAVYAGTSTSLKIFLYSTGGAWGSVSLGVVSNPTVLAAQGRVPMLGWNV